VESLNNALEAEQIILRLENKIDKLEHSDSNKNKL
jgi:hypothetical protein